MKRTIVSLALIVVFAAAPLLAGDWPHWRGPKADGTSDDTRLPTVWGGTNVLWRHALPGPGASTPIVTGKHVFVTSADGDAVVLMAFDRRGEELWRRTLDERNFVIRQGESNAASPSPTTDGERVWAFTGTGILAAFTLDGTPIFRADLAERYGEFDMYHGMSTTPLLHEGRLYLSLLHSGAQQVVALDAATGVPVWRHERATDARAECLHAYTSPVLVGTGDAARLLVHGADYLTAHRLGDGAEVWRKGGLQHPDRYNPAFRLVATPVVHDDLVIVPSAKNGPVLALETAGAEGDLGAGEKGVRWKLTQNTPDVPTPVVHDGLVYLSRENGQLLTVDVDSGALIYAERVHDAPHRGSPVVADGKVYLMGMDGTVSVVRAGREYALLAQNAMNERLAASLAIADGTLYLRTYRALYAIALPPVTAPEQ